MKLALLLLLFSTLNAGGHGGTAFPTSEEAIKDLFPGSTLRLDYITLSSPEQKRASDLAGTTVSSKNKLWRVVGEEGELLGFALIDTHRVRNKRESLLISWTEDGRALGPRVLGFAEPLQYLPRAKWYGQFKGKALKDSLRLRGDIDGISGATLSARATVKAVRRGLAIDEVLSARISK
jgi:hypothetical protein